MSLMQCRGCPAKYVVGLLRCPRCQTMCDLYADAGAGAGGIDMPKISAHGGPTNADEPVEEVAEGTARVQEDAPVEAVAEVEATEEVAVEPESEPEPTIVEDVAVPEPAKKPARATKKTAAPKP